MPRMQQCWAQCGGDGGSLLGRAVSVKWKQEGKTALLNE